MLLSRFFLPMLKETPADAELVSHRLMLRAGMIRKVASGVYTWLPIGLRVLKRVEAIIREEMDAAGAQELLMPAVQPAELWEESGRWEQYGPELLRLQDRHDRRFCFGPTHEEIITDVVRGELRSYKQVPLTVYQVQTKFRDEIRPRFGVMRAREFMMKDAYSFDVDLAGMQKSYDVMFEAYNKILTRLGLTYRPVLADTGSIGGEFSHEFQVLADSGEDLVAVSDGSDYAANVERAQSQAPTGEREAPADAMTLFDTPNCRSIQDMMQQFNMPAERCLKTLVVRGVDNTLVALVLRGDHELNEIKAEKLEGVAVPFSFATDAEIKAGTNSESGYVGPVDLNIPVVVDRDAALAANFVCGANQKDKHYKNVNWERDVPLTQVADIRNVVEGDASPDGKGKLFFKRGIEVGHVFQLGDKYSQSMDASVLNDDGKKVTLQMGCYGMGVSRIVAAAIEQHHDDRGIIWPEAMAPFQVAIVPMQMHKSYRVREVAEKLYTELREQGVDVLLDDRKERPGAMFATMDLIGIPHRLVIGEKGLDQGTVEYKKRSAEDVQHVELAQLSAFLTDLL